MYRGANTLCLLCAEVLSVGTARHGPARAWRGLSQRTSRQGGSESNIGTWASTLVVPYPFDPEFWSGCSSSVGGTAFWQLHHGTNRIWIEREREKVPSFLRTRIRAARLRTYITICCIGGIRYIPDIKKQGGVGMGKTHVIFFCSKSS